MALPDPITAARVLTEAALDLCAGQSQDLAFERSDTVTLQECVRMAEGKTGALLGVACELGGLSAGADPEAARRYRTFGRHLGVAFQLVDDLLGIWGDPKKTGKPVGADLRARKKTLPVVAALESGTRTGEQLARIYTQGQPLDDDTVVQCAHLVDVFGGRTWTQAEVERRVQKAFTMLPNTAALGACADLRALADLIVRRDQ